jgi:2-iminobutanoate/2-iminopropanoate deaminase
MVKIKNQTKRRFKMKEIIKTKKAPEALGPYSQGVAAGNFCFVSMELGINPKTNELENKTIEQETKTALENVKNILKEADFSLDDVIKVTLYVTDLSLFGKINDEYAKFFKNDPPARALVVQSSMPLDAKVAVDAIAYKE